MENKRNFGLDILRATAIILVIFSHTAFIISEKYNFEATYILGYLGVEIFFVLSGFLIGGILIKLINKPEGFTFSTIKSFWIRRGFRTLPNYYLVFFLTVINELVHQNPFNFKYLNYLVFSQNLISPHPNFFDQAWSLSVEEWFYFTFPMVMLLIQQIFYKLKRPSKPLINLLAAIIFYIVGCLIIRIVFTHISGNDWDYGFRKVVVLRLDAIAIGVLFALFKCKYPEIWLKYSKKMLWLGMPSLVFMYGYFIYSFIIFKNESFFLKTAFLSLISFGIAFSLPFFEGLKISKTSLVNNLILKFSLYSYSMYLVHVLIIQYVNSKLVAHIFHLNAYMKFVLIWVLIFCVSKYLYKYFEKPTTDLRDKWK